MNVENTTTRPEGAEELIRLLETRIAELEALTEEQRAIIEDLLEKLARDPMLVGLYNSRGFRDKTEGLINREVNRRDPGVAGQLAVVLVDIDKFKVINDTHGHMVGDKVLEALAKILATSRRDEDVVARLGEEEGSGGEVLAGRLGGDEFAVALPGADAEGAQRVLDRIKQAVSEEKIVVGGQEVGFSVSGGIAVFEGGMDVDKMLDRADEEMYKDKGGGRTSGENRGEVA